MNVNENGKYSPDFVAMIIDQFSHRASDDLSQILRIRNILDSPTDTDLVFEGYWLGNNGSNGETEVKKIADKIRSYSDSLKNLIADMTADWEVVPSFWSIYHPDFRDSNYGDGRKWHYAEFDSETNKVIVREYGEIDIG